MTEIDTIIKTARSFFRCDGTNEITTDRQVLNAISDAVAEKTGDENNQFSVFVKGLQAFASDITIGLKTTSLYKEPSYHKKPYAYAKLFCTDKEYGLYFITQKDTCELSVNIDSFHFIGHKHWLPMTEFHKRSGLEQLVHYSKQHLEAKKTIVEQQATSLINRINWGHADQQIHIDVVTPARPPEDPGASYLYNRIVVGVSRQIGAYFHERRPEQMVDVPKHIGEPDNFLIVRINVATEEKLGRVVLDAYNHGQRMPIQPLGVINGANLLQ